jgi:hypothetical protein
LLIAAPYCDVYIFRCQFFNLADFVKPSHRIGPEQFLFGVLVVVDFYCLLSSYQFNLLKPSGNFTYHQV